MNARLLKATPLCCEASSHCGNALAHNLQNLLSSDGSHCRALGQSKGSAALGFARRLIAEIIDGKL